MAKYEHELRAFDGAGLDDVETDSALTYLLGFVQASARAAGRRPGGRRAQRPQRPSQWWAENGPLLAKVLDPQPTRTADAGRRGGGRGAGRRLSTPATRTRSAWQRVLDGLGVLIERRRQ